MKFLRIIPLTIFTALLLLALKIVDVSRGTEAVSEMLSIASATATEAEKPAEKEAKPADADHGEKATGKKSEEKKEAKESDAKEGKKEDGKPEAKGEGKEGKKEDGKPEAKGEGKEGEKKEGDKKEEGKDAHGGGEKDKEKKNPAVSGSVGTVTDRFYTASEVEVLKNLSKRREDLDRWADNIQVKEATLAATEKRIGEKIDQINAMKREVSDLLAQYNAKEDAKLKSLVKIYENMKPKDAARIFNDMEMPVLLLVIDKMSEKKAAPILADMEPRKAKQITVELAEQRRLDTTKLENVSNKTAQ